MNKYVFYRAQAIKFVLYVFVNKYTFIVSVTSSPKWTNPFFYNIIRYTNDRLSIMEGLVKKAAIFGVDSTVLERLSELVPFHESISYLTSGNCPRDFWCMIDTLPSAVSLELHALAASIPTHDRDFPEDTIGPLYQDIWLARNPELSLVNRVAVTQISAAQFRECLDKSTEWEDNDNTWTSKACGASWSFSTLHSMCNAFLMNGKPWIFCAVDAIRVGYIELDRIVERLEKAENALDLSAIRGKMCSFQYSTSDEFAQDLKAKGEKGVAGNTEPFTCSTEITAAVRALMRSCTGGVQTVPDAEPCEWACGRAGFVSDQAAIPVENWTTCGTTAQILQARTGQSCEAVFERDSLEALLFTSSNGEVLSLPYTNCRAALPRESPVPTAKNVFRTFVAQELIANNFETANESCMDILTDIVVNAVRQIAEEGSKLTADRKGAKGSDAAVVGRALRALKYDTFSMTMPRKR